MSDVSTSAAADAFSQRTESEREQIELQAAYINGLAIGIFLIGGFSIPSAVLLSAGSLIEMAIGITFGAICVIVSPILHRYAKGTLRLLDR